MQINPVILLLKKTRPWLPITPGIKPHTLLDRTFESSAGLAPGFPEALSFPLSASPHALATPSHSIPGPLHLLILLSGTLFPLPRFHGHLLLIIQPQFNCQLLERASLITFAKGITVHPLGMLYSITLLVLQAWSSHKTPLTSALVCGLSPRRTWGL